MKTITFIDCVLNFSKVFLGPLSVDILNTNHVAVLQLEMLQEIKEGNMQSQWERKDENCWCVQSVSAE